MSEILSLSRDDRAQLAAHLESVGGWPAGFGHLGTRIVHETTEDGSFSVLSEDAAHLWEDLCKLVADAGLHCSRLSQSADVPPHDPPAPSLPQEPADAPAVPAEPPADVPSAGDE